MCHQRNVCTECCKTLKMQRAGCSHSRQRKRTANLQPEPGASSIIDLRTQYKTQLTAYSTDRVRDAPQHTDQHGTSWRSDVPPPCLGGASHGWVPVNTHGTPVLTSVRRPWVAQPRPRAHASDTRRETRSANSKCADHPNMIVEQGW